MRALILEGSASRGCLAAARSLARAGWRVDLGRGSGHSLAGDSSAVRRIVPLPSLREGLDEYLVAVAAAVADGGHDLVMGAGDAELLALAVGRDRIPAVVPHADHAALMRAVDKVHLREAAQAVGIATPDDADDVAGSTVRGWLRDGPVVVKPRMHWDPERPTAPLRVDAGLARTPEELRLLDELVTEAGGTTLVQRFVAGRLMAYIVLLDDERCIAHAQQRAVHTWPEPVGVSARAVTEPVDAQLAAASYRLLRELGITGLVELQFLVDDGGTHHLIDLNARCYGSLQLSIAAGADFPRLWADAALGRRAPDAPPVTARPGVHYQWLEGDLRRSVQRRDVLGSGACLTHALRAHHSVWSARDPRPGLGQAAELARRVLGRRRPA